MTPPSEQHGLLIVDKSRGPTSHDVVGVARRALGTREIGHTGTLDPMATGVLVLVIGEATKLVNALSATTKSYQATIALGSSTTTLDAEGEVDGSAPLPELTEAAVVAAASRFLGATEQRAPAVSAIKVEGRSLYKRARSGEVFEPPLRQVRLDTITLRALRGSELDLELTCGAGFYVRALARDLAAALGTLGHLTSLRRTRNGAFGLERAVSFEQLLRARDDREERAVVAASVLPLAQVCHGLPHIVLDDAGVLHARHGRAISLEHVLSTSGTSVEGQPLIAFDSLGVPVALVSSSLDGVRVVRGFRGL